MPIRARLLLLALALPALSTCGSSSDVNVTSPSLTRCGVSVTASAGSLPASGGSGTLTIDTERECAWSAVPEGTWISLGSTTGQGPASVTYSVAANPDSSSRRGAVVVEQQRVEIAQEAAPCRYDVSPRAVAANATADSASVSLTAGNGCSWSVHTSAPWVTSAPDRGNGSGTIRLNFAANTDAAPRTATVIIAGVQVDVTQSGTAGARCNFSVSPGSISVNGAGGQTALAVSAPAGCGWSASSSVPWIAVLDEGARAGSGTVTLQISANGGAARSASVAVAGRAVAVSQSAAGGGPPCAYTITPGSRSIGASATELAVEVSSSAGCAWTASSTASWITVTAGASGSGNGTVRLAIGANNTGAQRSGRATIAGATFQVDQASAPAPCAYSIKPAYYSAGRGPDDVSVDVSAGAGCTWTVNGVPSWVTVPGSRSGSGNGTVRLTLAANSGPARSATLQIAGESFALNQNGSCAATIKPTYYNSGRGPDEFEVAVMIPAGCSWTASSPVDWLVILSGAGGAGGGVVAVRIQANSEGSRAAVLTIAGERVTVTQEGR